MDLATRIDIPGSWFGATEAGALNAGEKRSKYVAVAVEFNAKHVLSRPAADGLPRWAKPYASSAPKTLRS